MKKNFILYIILIVSFCTCKKYDEGGLVRLTRKHLYGGNELGDSKTWKLKRYEVNGIDSTYLIPGTSTIPDFYDKFVTFCLTDEKYWGFQAKTFLQTYGGSIDRIDKRMLIGIEPPKNHLDSMQCSDISGITYCVRNILFPEFNNYRKSWNIKKLTKSELIIETNWKLKNSYKIILTH